MLPSPNKLLSTPLIPESTKLLANYCVVCCQTEKEGRPKKPLWSGVKGEIHFRTDQSMSDNLSVRLGGCSPLEEENLLISNHPLFFFIVWITPPVSVPRFIFLSSTKKRSCEQLVRSFAAKTNKVTRTPVIPRNPELLSHCSRNWSPRGTGNQPSCPVSVPCRYYRWKREDLGPDSSKALS